MPPRNPDDPTRQQQTIEIEHARPATRDPRQVVVTYRLPSPCAPGLDHARVDEGPERVVITLHRELPDPEDRRVCVQMIVERSTRVGLDKPLADRVVVDGTTGRRVRG